MEIIIRETQPKDATAIAHIIRELGWFEYLDSEAPTTTAERIKHHISLCLADKSHSTFVAETKTGKVIGYASVHYLPYYFLMGPEGYISELFIDLEYRSQSIGTLLLEQIVSEAKKRGCSRLTLINSRTRESYKRKFYEQHGWTERTEVAPFVFPLM